MKWDCQLPAKAAVERCRGCASTSPPQGLLTFPLIYPPTSAQGRARASGQRGGFLNPAKLICMGFAKNGLTSSLASRRAHPPSRRVAGQSAAQAHPGPPAAPAAPAALAAPPSYTHRPLRRAAHGVAGRGADFSIPQNSFVWVSLKMGSRAGSRAGARTPPFAPRLARAPRDARAHAARPSGTAYPRLAAYPSLAGAYPT